jgi:hypothetical protein
MSPTAVRDTVFPCPNWFHGDTCDDADCRRRWRERGEDRHLLCPWCWGQGWVQVTARSAAGDILRVEPFSP